MSGEELIEVMHRISKASSLAGAQSLARDAIEKHNRLEREILRCRRLNGAGEEVDLSAIQDGHARGEPRF